MKLLLKILPLLFVVSSIHISQAQISASKVFTDHMVLQREADIPVWGNAKAGTKVTVELNQQKQSAYANADGQWQLDLPALQAGGPYILNIYENESTSPSVSFKDVLIGDVWLASGQSNMEWQVQQAMNADEEIKNADYPQIRFLKVEHAKEMEPQAEIKNGKWKVIDSASVKDFSAVAYYFSRKIYADINVPVGIIQSTWGGTPVEAWTSREQLLSSPVIRDRVLANDTITIHHIEKDSLDLIKFWELVYNPHNGTEKRIPKKNYNDTDWPTVAMPITIKNWDIPPYEGMVWLRKTIDLPKSMTGKDLTINLGHPELNYSLYFNGTEICKNVWNAEPKHSYTIPKKAVRKGKNTIAVRIAYLWGGGGFNPPAEEMYITDNNSNISLDGEWKYKKDLEPTIPTIMNYHRYPSYLYNGMINPVIPYAIKGFIWYQGEDNVKEATDYDKLFPLLINDWRIRWQQGYLPFIYVQLANYMKRKPEPSESDWAVLREAQTKTLLQPNTGMACIIDIGEAETIHPLNKQEVGRRLALLAENMVYGKQVQAYGPMYKNYSIEGGKVIIEFTETADGLSISKNADKLKGFAIAGKDQQWHWAEAEIKGNQVIVHSPQVSEPTAVRYNWADNPEGNLINSSGLPAVPFRTDNWPTVKQK
ncbi:sialate O-acetylesterase [Fulvivirga maritima]|uniref:sialate O-acetylesterase n=1 Tax=Fulvivirga maritima TaxID=2904247 RepID=UPI001F181DBE|nr:sialate O-acetylesterase [Fulvivirga maritima]UII26916.1 sialate O-acetylesterase [Fulvivirga maritima]